ncbi:DUF4232 domain-containing protein [Umezawaea beigongshangensis]|uniref:DUF4232 domain-containing protein n=1 Tax=Umezawaea beigongshangensis TaxID=2780383 RepID=UPI0018F187C4|nr:DUF4232 domain-containing protein [Umezawaea beigongshangensis]
MDSTISRTGAVVLAACAVLGACTPQAPPPVTPTSTAADPCPSGVLLSAPSTEAASGVRVMRLEMINCGTRPYTVRGHPSVRLLDAGRAPLEVTITPGSSGISTVDSFDVPPRPVVLQPGERAVSGLLWRNTNTDPTIEPTTGEFLDLAPADGEPRQVVPSDGPVDLGTTGRLGVAPWSAAPRRARTGDSRVVRRGRSAGSAR